MWQEVPRNIICNTCSKNTLKWLPHLPGGNALKADVYHCGRTITLKASGLHIYLFHSLYLSLCLCICLYLSVCLCLCDSLSVCLSVRPSLSLSLSLSIYLYLSHSLSHSLPPSLPLAKQMKEKKPVSCHVSYRMSNIPCYKLVSVICVIINVLGLICLYR